MCPRSYLGIKLLIEVARVTFFHLRQQMLQYAIVHCIEISCVEGGVRKTSIERLRKEQLPGVVAHGSETLALFKIQ